MKPTVRLVAMTAPIHDAETLLKEGQEDLGIDDLVSAVEALNPDIIGWAFIDTMWLIEVPAILCGPVSSFFHGAVRTCGLGADPRTDLDTIVVKLAMTDLVDTFIEAQHDSSLDRVHREVLGVMWDMLSADFEDILGEVNPRDVDG